MKKLAFSITFVFLAITLIFSAPTWGSERANWSVNDIVSSFFPPSPAEAKVINKSLSFTDEQRTELKKLNQKYRADTSSLANKYKNVYDSTVHLIKSDNANAANVNSTLIKFHKVHQQFLDKEVEYWSEFKTLLTKEQNGKFWNLFEKSRIKK